MHRNEIIKYRKPLCQFVLLTAAVFFMVYASLSGIKEMTEETEEPFDKQTYSFLELKSGQSVEREFCFLKDENIVTEKIGIACKNALQMPGFLRVGFSQQGHIVQTEEVVLSEAGSLIYYDFELDPEQFTEDTVNLKLEYRSSNSDAVISIMSEEQQSDSEQKLPLDEKLSEQFPALRITYRISELSETASRIKRIMSICLPILLIVSLFQFCFSERKRLADVFLFASIFCIISLRYYFLILNCQPFAEELNVYIESAVQYGFPRNLLIRDAGYLAVLQHMITWICVYFFRFVGMKTVALVMNIIAVLAVAFCCVFPVRKISGQILPRPVTFGLSIAIPTILVRQYESFLFLNFIYFAFLLYIALLFTDFSSIKKGTYIWYLVFSGMLILSKGFFVVLFPAAVIGVLSHHKKDKRKMYWHLVIVIGSLCQLCVYFLCNAKDTASAMQLPFTDFAQIYRLIEMTGQVLTGIFMPYLSISTVGNICAGMIYILLVMSLVVICYRRKMTDTLYLFLQVIVTLFCNMFLAALGTPSMRESGTLFFSRQEFIGILMMIISLGMVGGMLCAKCNIKIILRKTGVVYIFLCSLILSLQTAAVKDKFWIASPNTDSFSTMFSRCSADYDIYADYISGDSFYIPSCPDYWYYSRNCDIYLYNSMENAPFWRTSRTYIAKSAEHLLEDKPYTDFELMELTGRSSGLKEVFVSRTSLQYEYEILCYDENVSLVASAGQLNDKRKWNIGYIFDEPVDHVYTVQFVNAKTKEPVTVKPEVIFVYAEE